MFLCSSLQCFCAVIFSVLKLSASWKNQQSPWELHQCCGVPMVVVGNFHAFRFTVSMKGVPSGRQAEGQADGQKGEQSSMEPSERQILHRNCGKCCV